MKKCINYSHTHTAVNLSLIVISTIIICNRAVIWLHTILYICNIATQSIGTLPWTFQVQTKTTQLQQYQKANEHFSNIMYENWNLHTNIGEFWSGHLTSRPKLISWKWHLIELWNMNFGLTIKLHSQLRSKFILGNLILIVTINFQAFSFAMP